MAVKKDKPAGLLADLADEPNAGSEEVRDLLDAIDEDDEAESWIPTERGDGVEGVVLSLGSRASDYGDPAPVVLLATDDGKKVRITGFQSVLRNEIEEKNPQIGDRFAVRYFGQKDSKKGQKYHHYKAAVSRGPGSGSGSVATGGRATAGSMAAAPPFLHQLS